RFGSIAYSLRAGRATRLARRAPLARVAGGRSRRADWLQIHHRRGPSAGPRRAHNLGRTWEFSSLFRSARTICAGNEIDGAPVSVKLREGVVQKPCRTKSDAFNERPA